MGPGHDREMVYHCREDIITDLEEQIAELTDMMEQLCRDHQASRKLVSPPGCHLSLLLRKCSMKSHCLREATGKGLTRPHSIAWILSVPLLVTDWLKCTQIAGCPRACRRQCCLAVSAENG